MGLPSLSGSDRASLIVDASHLVELVRQIHPGDTIDERLLGHVEAVASLMLAKLKAPSAELPAFLSNAKSNSHE